MTRNSRCRRPLESIDTHGLANLLLRLNDPCCCESRHQATCLAENLKGRQNHDECKSNPIYRWWQEHR